MIYVLALTCQKSIKSYRRCFSKLPLQLLADYTALSKGNDVDQPCNLAKSVKVE